MEQRKHPRMLVRNMQIDVSDGIGCCSGTVLDVSRVGLCLNNLAKRFGKNMDAFTVVAWHEQMHFKFRVRLRWERVNGMNKRVGVEIQDPPGRWTEYVQTMESRQRRV